MNLAREKKRRLASALLLRLFLCIAILAAFLYLFISKQNSITKIRLKIPQLSKKYEAILQENTRLKFEIDQFENPQNLMELARRPEYQHLKHPHLDEILSLDLREKK